MEHTCNAYCSPPEHCDLIYTTPGAHPDHIWQSLGYYRGLKVLRCEPAGEPPDPTMANDLIVGDRADATEPWLVWWT
ncbi:MAG: hypothetical protein Q7T33_14150 [Dehalococcoidia bacterium]|nr:hypothetical protein [Dehalococcoidia bacterium]